MPVPVPVPGPVPGWLPEPVWRPLDCSGSTLSVPGSGSTPGPLGSGGGAGGRIISVIGAGEASTLVSCTSSGCTGCAGGRTGSMIWVSAAEGTGSFNGVRRGSSSSEPVIGWSSGRA
ncbi:hypothetical protein GCM10027445_32370 [Amycolatopsis endophytica]